MIQFFTDTYNRYHFYNTDLHISNNQTTYKSFAEVYHISLITEEPYVDLLYTSSEGAPIGNYITDPVFLFECSYEDLPNLPSTHPELFI